MQGLVVIIGLDPVIQKSSRRHPGGRNNLRYATVILDFRTEPATDGVDSGSL
jgi:hypothetical protein